MLQEINFDGLVGPSHNYAGLSLGNLASARNAGRVSRPKAAALQGLAKMRANLSAGLLQGILLPHPRPHNAWLAQLSTDMAGPAPLPAWAMSAAAMWTANAATVSPAPDTSDGRCHLTVANLVTMPHRSHEWPSTLAQLRIAFADPRYFAVHGPVPPPFGDEGAANHMRFAARHDAPGVEVLVFGEAGGPFPARQSRVASEAVARRHGLDPARTLMVQQSAAAIAAGAFHNDVVAVADGRTLFAHEQAFEDRDATLAAIAAMVPNFELVEVPASEVSLVDAIRSYLFNAQLVTLAGGEQMLVLPTDAREVPSVADWVQRNLNGNGPIRRVGYVDVRESMANGGGPACLRLRVVADPVTVDPRFMVDDARIAMIEAVVARHWPNEIDPSDIASPSLIGSVEAARLALLEAMELTCAALLSG